ncbi:AAA family ATPase [Curtobacterium ammoniigenes]|uniref:AAA family ATPase n=1 Tax=Curtobacterium ammoniigenes TaxID=395387 RepID=UPI00082D9010|nr:AAA family ATPase [Curtobacterium ammoniigenes]
MGTSGSIRRVQENTLDPMPRGPWPTTVPAVRQLLDDGLDLSPITILVGENGAGKSTVVEAVALAFGMSAEGGSTGANHSTRPSESALWQHLTLVREPGAPRRGFFLRAETMHGFFTYLEEHPGARAEPRFHELSHGESFLEVIVDRFRGPGLWVLDEPESALSFSGCLALIGALEEATRANGSQVILSTHSPILARMPGARVLELDDWGFHETSWEELPLVQNWRSFLDDPERYFRHLR